jgi:hypothetical protein
MKFLGRNIFSKELEQGKKSCMTGKNGEALPPEFSRLRAASIVHHMKVLLKLDRSSLKGS